MRIAIAGATGMIGSLLTALAEDEGHEVVAITRGAGYDLLDSDTTEVEAALEGADAAVDVTSTMGVTSDEETLAFFTGVAHHLGRAARSAGVERTVTLSIVGIDRAPDYGYYVAKLAQEHAAREAHPGAVLLRATQFHEFAQQVHDWNREGQVTRTMDVPTQPVDTREVVRLLLDLAAGAVVGDQELAGPREERLLDLVQRYADHAGAGVRVETAPAPASLAAGAMLPDHDGVLRRGADWSTWLAAQPARARS